jgi:secreted PhoX family phosphatase
MSASPHRLLPLLPHAGGRSATVCHYRCGDACAQPVPNTSDNEYLGDVIAASLSRRALLTGAAGVVGLGAAATLVEPSSARAATTGVAASTTAKGNGLGFTPIAPDPVTVDAVSVPAGFTWSTLISWGDPVLKGAPRFDFENQTSTAQALQFGYNNDFTALIQASSRDGVLFCNHEYTNEALMFAGWVNDAAASVEQLRISMAAHGLSVVEVSRRSVSKPWTYDPKGRKNRRFTTQTPFKVTGPAAGSRYLKTSADPSGTKVLGTLNNCSGSVTPWGTILSGEENFNQYFRVAAAPTDAEIAAGYRRYGVLTGSAGRDWYRADERFDTGVEPNEPHRFGWIVEVDPDDAHSTPRKHTSLGRFKHEAATIRIAHDGRAAAYSGDDERFDYLYKFISKDRYRKGKSRRAKRHNMSLLAEGDLYVARFDGTPSPEYDGTGVWLPLIEDGVSKVPGMNVEQVLVFTRLAADKVAATKMDRPEDVQPNPVTGKVYMSCTNNANRTPAQVDAANPRAANKFGHVIEITETGNDSAALTFDWVIVLVCGNPEDPSTYFSGYDKSKVSPISSPDNVAFDRAGNLWIATDGQYEMGLNDALHAVPVKGPERGHVQQFLSVPKGAETCGPVISEDGYTVLVAVQHPGDVAGASAAAPASTFPYDGTGQPRPSVIQVRRKDGRPRV